VGIATKKKRIIIQPKGRTIVRVRILCISISILGGLIIAPHFLLRGNVEIRDLTGQRQGSLVKGPYVVSKSASVAKSAIPGKPSLPHGDCGMLARSSLQSRIRIAPFFFVLDVISLCNLRLNAASAATTMAVWPQASTPDTVVTPSSLSHLSARRRAATGAINFVQIQRARN